MRRFDKTALKTELQALSGQSRLAYMLLLTEHLMPALAAFAADTKYPYMPYRDALDAAWKFLTHDVMLSKAVKGALPDPPDSDDYQHPLSEAALDAALAVESVRDYLQNSDLNEIVDVARRAHDIAANQVSERLLSRENGRTLRDIADDPIMQRELERQSDGLEFVKALGLPIDMPQLQKIKKWLSYASVKH